MGNNELDYISKCSEEIIKFIINIRNQTGFNYAYVNLIVINDLFRNGILLEVSPKIKKEEINKNIFGVYFFPIKRKNMSDFMIKFTTDFNNTKKETYLVERILGSKKYWFDIEQNKLQANSLSRKKLT